PRRLSRGEISGNASRPGFPDHQKGAQMLSSPAHRIIARRKAPLPRFVRSRLDRDARPQRGAQGGQVDTGVAAKIQDIDDNPTLPMIGAAYLPGVAYDEMIARGGDVRAHYA